MTYFGTYITANIIDTAAATRNGGDIKAVTAGTEKFVATSTYVIVYSLSTSTCALHVLLN